MGRRLALAYGSEDESVIRWARRVIRPQVLSFAQHLPFITKDLSGSWLIL